MDISREYELLSILKILDLIELRFSDSIDNKYDIISDTDLKVFYSIVNAVHKSVLFGYNLKENCDLKELELIKKIMKKCEMLAEVE